MESIGFLVNDIIQCLSNHIHHKPDLLTAAGGGAREPLLQFIADLTNIPVGHSAMKDRTAYGVYKLLNPNYESDVSKSVDHVFLPNETDKIIEKKEKWKQTIQDSLH
jgi:glycerol kinase